MRFFVGILLCVFQLNCTFSNHKKLIKKNIHQIPSITITPYNDGKRISYTFKSDIPIKFKLVKTYNNYLMFLNNKFKIGLDKLQNSIVKTVFEPGKFTNLRFIPRIPEAEYYGHTVQISDKSFKLTFSKHKPQPIPYATMQDVKNMLIGQAYIITKFSRDTMKFQLNSPIRKDICTFKRGDYTYIAIETDHEIRFNLPAKKYVPFSTTIFKNGLQLIILKTGLFHRTTQTEDGWLIEFSKTPDSPHSVIEDQFLIKSHTDNPNPKHYPDLRTIVNPNKNILPTIKFLENGSKELRFELLENAFFFKIQDPIFKDEIIIIPLYNPIKNRNHISTPYFDMLKSHQGIAIKLNDSDIKATYQNTSFVLTKSEPFLFANPKIKPLCDLLKTSNFSTTVPWLVDYKHIRKSLLNDPFDIALFNFNKFMTKHLLTKESQQNFYQMIKRLKSPNLKTQVFLIMGINAFLNYDFDEAIYFLENQQLSKDETLNLLIKISYALNNPNITKFSIPKLMKFTEKIADFGEKIHKQILLTMLKFNKKIDPESFSVILNQLSQFKLSDNEKALFYLNRARSFIEQNLYSQALEDLKSVKTSNLLIFNDSIILKNVVLLKLGKISEDDFLKTLESMKVCNSYGSKEINETLLKFYMKKKMFLKAIMLMKNNPYEQDNIQNIINKNYPYFMGLPLPQLIEFMTHFDKFTSRECKKSIAMFFLQNKFLIKSFNMFRDVILRYKIKSDIDDLISILSPFLIDGEIIDFLKDNAEYIGITNDELSIYFARIYYLQKRYNLVIDTLKNFNLKKSKKALEMIAQSYFMEKDFHKSEILFLKMFEIFRKTLSENDIMNILVVMIHNNHYNAAHKLYTSVKNKLSVKYENRIRRLFHSAKN